MMDNTSFASTTREEQTDPVLPQQKYHIERNNALSFDGKKLNSMHKEQVSEVMGVMMSWPNWDIWPFKVAIPAVTLAAVLPGIFINKTFRSALLLGHYGRASSYLSTVGIPALCTAAAQMSFVTTDIIQQKTKCPVCVQVRSASIQVALGFVYPAILGTVVNCAIASGMKNLYFPKFTKQPKEVARFVADIFKSVKGTYLGIGALQIIIGMGVAHLQQRCYYNTLLPVLSGKTEFSEVTRQKSHSF